MALMVDPVAAAIATAASSPSDTLDHALLLGVLCSPFFSCRESHAGLSRLEATTFRQKWQNPSANHI
jgi:hypothetical protein